MLGQESVKAQLMTAYVWQDNNEASFFNAGDGALARARRYVIFLDVDDVALGFHTLFVLHHTSHLMGVHPNGF
jgi:hypothetical protein